MSDQEDVYDDDQNPQEEEEKFEDSSEEDEEEDEDKYEQDDFIVQDDDDDDGSAPEPEPEQDEEPMRKKKKKKKRRYREDSPELAEGDLQLLEDEGVRIDRRPKLRRLRKGASDEEAEELDDDMRDLAQDDDDRIEERRRRADDPVDYDDDMGDFIDDSGRSRRRRASEREGLVSSEAVRQARSIFGDVDEMTEYKGMDKLLQREDGAGDEDDEDFRLDADNTPKLRKIRARDTDLSGGEDGQMPPEAQTQPVEDGVIAQELTARGGDNEEAQRIIKVDVPERLQHHFGPRYKTPDESYIRDEARWIHRKCFQSNPDFGGDAFASEDLLQKINICLSYIHIDKLDVPFIAMYRKDYISKLLVPSAGEFLRTDKIPTNPEKAMDPPRGFNSLRAEDSRPGFTYDHLRGVPRGYDDGFGDWSIVWTILDMDKKYAELVKRRNALLDELKLAEEKGVPTLVIEDVRLMADTCEDESELRDGERYLRLAVELADSLEKDKDNETNANKPKRPVRRRRRYADFCKRGYRLLAREFGISARQFGENFKGAAEFGAGTQMHVPFESESEPLETAQLFAIRTGGVRTDDPELEKRAAEKMLAAARFILATEIFSDMQVIQTARRILTAAQSVSITTTPTPQGISQVDETHPLRCVTSIQDRSLEKFEKSVDFALITRAEELGYTVMEIKFQEEQLSLLKKHLTTSIIVDSVTSNNVTEWNQQRMMIVDEVHDMLVKHVRDEVQVKLTESTAVSLRDTLSRAASRRLMLGPGPSGKDDGCPRVLAFSVTREEDEEPDPLQDQKDLEAIKESKSKSGGMERRIAPERITVVDLDENGEYANAYELFAAWLRRPTRSDLEASKLSADVVDQLKSFIIRSKAQMIVIGVGSGGRAAVRLQQDLMDVVKKMACDRSSSEDESTKIHMLDDEELGKIRGAELEADPQNNMAATILSKYIVLVDDFPARIYAKTEGAAVGLPMDGMTILEKRTIALARLAQEPLWVYSAIGIEKDSVAHLKFHPYHYYASLSDRRIAFHRALIRAVCGAGVDINRSLRLPHMQSMLSFVGGLGPYKAKALLDSLGDNLSEDDRGLLSRKHLWTRNFIGRTVFLSAAAFLRVRDPELHNGGSTKRAVELRRSKLGRKGRVRRRDDDRHAIFDPMDDSRVHPEHYSVALKIADESLRDDQGRLILDMVEQDEFSESLRMTAAVLDNPHELNKLALDDYAAHLQELGRGSLFETVRTIAAEYKGPFKDHRRPLCMPGHEALFYLVTGADPMTVRPGSAVTATNCQVRMKRRNDAVSGISCMLPHSIRGFIPAHQFSDEQALEPRDFRHLVPDGSTLACRIIDFLFDKFEAVLTSKVSLIENPSEIRGYVPAIDFNDPTMKPYPAIELTESSKPIAGVLADANSRARGDSRRHDTVNRLTATSKSIVQHPRFKNVSGEQATGVLRSALPGDVIIRPSQYDRDTIVFSCKFASISNQPDRGVLHVSCVTMPDPENPSTTTRLKIEDNIYEHVDHVLEQFLRPIISNLSECLDHRKFKVGKVTELKEFVKKQKMENPHLNPYCFGLSERRATGIVILFIPGSQTVVVEEIEVVPDGFRFRGTLHMSLNALIMFFKKNMTSSGPMATRPATVTRERVPQSPFGAPAEYGAAERAASPFHRAAASPYGPTASPYHAARSPYESRPMAQPAADEPPPPAPAMGPNMGDGGRGGRYESNTVWDNATRHRDEPPPSIQNGGHGGRGGGFSDRGRGRMGGGGGGGGGRGPDGPGGRGGGGDGRGPMPHWRGQAPVPAWKKAAEGGQH